MTHKRVIIFALILIVFTLSSSGFGQSGWTPKKLQTSSDLVGLYFTSVNTGWVAGDNGYLASTKDGGTTWRIHNIGVKANINEIYFRNDKNGYLVAGARMFATSDGGDTWKEIRIYAPAEFRRGTKPEFLSIRFSDKKRGIVVGSVLNNEEEVLDSLVMRTDDGGETWKRLTVPSKVELFHLDLNGSSHGWIVGDEGMILASTDYGQTWNKQNSGVRTALFNVDFNSDDEGIAVGEKGTVVYTADGGMTWQKRNVPHNERFMRVAFTDSRNVWVVGGKGVVIRSNDKGETWIDQQSKTNSDLYGLFMDKRYGYAVGANGLLLHYY